MREIKPVFPEKHDFEYQDELITLAHFAIFLTSDSDAKMEVNDFSIEPSTTSVLFPIETLMEEIRATVFKKFEL